MIRSSFKNTILCFIISFLTLSHVNCNIWDNIFSQAEASHPINMTESFNIDIQLPDQLQLNANIDFNSQLKALTVTFSKNLLIQDISLIKAQVDLESLNLNVDQFLLGCEKFKLGVEEQTNQKIHNSISSVNFSKKSLFLINLLFKYIGKYELSQGTIGQNESPSDSILDIFKNSKFLDKISQSGVFGDLNTDKILGKKIPYNMFEFSFDLYKDPQQVIDRISKQKQTVSEQIGIEQLEDFDLTQIDFSQLRFVILADSQTGQIVKAFRNKQMKEQLNLSLKSKEKGLIKCSKQAKPLTINDLTNGAKYLYDNKDTIQDVFERN